MKMNQCLQWSEDEEWSGVMIMMDSHRVLSLTRVNIWFILVLRPGQTRNLVIILIQGYKRHFDEQSNQSCKDSNVDIFCNICEDDCGEECDEENGDGVKCKEEEGWM